MVCRVRKLCIDILTSKLFGTSFRNLPNTIDQLHRSSRVGISCYHISCKDISSIVVSILSFEPECERVTNSYGRRRPALVQNHQSNLRVQRTLFWEIFNGDGTSRPVNQIVTQTTVRLGNCSFGFCFDFG